jgi:hypothetical protein
MKAVTVDPGVQYMLLRSRSIRLDGSATVIRRRFVRGLHGRFRWPSAGVLL